MEGELENPTRILISVCSTDNCNHSDGHYGLWIDDSVEKGISESCPTFGNEPLSDEGKKFDILGVEIWYIA